MHPGSVLVWNQNRLAGMMKHVASFLAGLLIAGTLLAAAPAGSSANPLDGKFRTYHWTSKASATHSFRANAGFHLQVHMVGCSKHPRFTMFKGNKLVFISVKYGRHDFTSPKYPAGSYRLRILLYKGRCSWSVWVRKGL